MTFPEALESLRISIRCAVPVGTNYAPFLLAIAEQVEENRQAMVDFKHAYDHHEHLTHNSRRYSGSPVSPENKLRG